MKDMAKFAGRQQLQPSDIAETMLKMVESKEYDGGTCVLKTPYEEKIQEDGYTKQVEKMKEYDPVSIVIPPEVSHSRPRYSNSARSIVIPPEHMKAKGSASQGSLTYSAVASSITGH